MRHWRRFQHWQLGRFSERAASRPPPIFPSKLCRPRCLCSYGPASMAGSTPAIVGVAALQRRQFPDFATPIAKEFTTAAGKQASKAAIATNPAGTGTRISSPASRYVTISRLSAQPPTAVVALADPTVVNTTRIDPLLIGPHLGFTTNANRTLWYAAGGLALGQVGGNSVGGTAATVSTANPPSAWATGWFIGAGVEQMLTNNWGVKVEYDYVRT